ncbi:hypothetical protein N7465_010162 [Penicillium sp. CMV-2018d]|nr:hypothetical protein N7465_010162 [Penicillium sp. CMV-2018d]
MTSETSNIFDGVVRYPPTGINVVIVGAGLAGLLAALECWRKGHEVQVVERGPEISQAGDIIGLGPHAWVTIREYPKMFEEWNRISYDPESYICLQNGNLALPRQELEYNQEGIAKHAVWPLRAKGLIFRRDLAFMYLAQCERLGIPITFDVNVVEYSDDISKGTATAHTDDGRNFTGDVVVAADGIGTKSHNIVLGKPARAVSTGYCVDRVAYPTAGLKDAPALTKIIAELERPHFRVYNGHRSHAVVIITKDRLAINITREDDGTATESWASEVSPAQMAEGVQNDGTWDPLLVEAVKNIPCQSIVRWKLCWRDPQPKWTSAGGRIMQIGDAAHSLLPTSVNGAAMALEDSMSLAECLRLGGKEGIPAATKVHQMLRYERTTLIQHCGFVNRRELHNMTMEDMTKNGKPPFLYGKWLWTHNAEKYAAANFDAARENLEFGRPFQNTNLPPGHKFEHWTMEGELEKEKTGVFTQDLRNNGDWSSA